MKKLTMMVVILIGFQTMAQNFVAQNTQVENILFLGFENTYNFGQIGCEQEYELEAVNCVLIKVNPDADDHAYIIKTTGREKTAAVNFVADGKILSTINFMVQPLPKPDLYWGGQVTGSNFSNSSELKVKYGKGVPLKTTYNVLSWSSTHNSNTFKGEGNLLSEEFLS